MNVHADKLQENKSRSGANDFPRKNTSKSISQFVDNRPEVMTNRNLQMLASDSPAVKQLMHIQEVAHRSPRVNQLKMIQNIVNTPRLNKTGKSNKDGIRPYVPIQLAKMSHGTNLGYMVQGQNLFLNSHFTQPDIGENFHPHCTTQVSLDYQYIGSIRTFYNPISKQRYQVVDQAVKNLPGEHQGWAFDTHQTFIASIFGH